MLSNTSKITISYHDSLSISAEGSARHQRPNGPQVCFQKPTTFTKTLHTTLGLKRRQGRLQRETALQADSAPIRAWTQFTNHTFTELIDLRDKHERSTDKRERFWEESALEEFIGYLRTHDPETCKFTCGCKHRFDPTHPKPGKFGCKHKLLPNTISRHWGTVHGFYSYHNYPLRDKASKSWTTTEFHPIIINDVRDAYRVADVQARFVLSALTATGLGNEDLSALKLGDGTPSIHEQLNSGRSYIVLRILRSKTKVAFRSIWGPAVVSDLQAYLTYRRSKGEQLDSKSALIVGEREGDTDYRDISHIVKRCARASGKDWIMAKLLRTIFNQSSRTTNCPNMRSTGWVTSCLRNGVRISKTCLMMSLSRHTRKSRNSLHSALPSLEFKLVRDSKAMVIAAQRGCLGYLSRNTEGMKRVPLLSSVRILQSEKET